MEWGLRWEHISTKLLPLLILDSYYNLSAFHCSKWRTSVTIAYSLDLNDFIRHLHFEHVVTL
jgi:hypothetical protein